MSRGNIWGRLLCRAVCLGCAFGLFRLLFFYVKGHRRGLHRASSAVFEGGGVISDVISDVTTGLLEGKGLEGNVIK